MSLPSRDDAMETQFPEFASGYSWYEIASPLTADTTAGLSSADAGAQGSHKPFLVPKNATGYDPLDGATCYP